MLSRAGRRENTKDTHGRYAEYCGRPCAGCKYDKQTMYKSAVENDPEATDLEM